MRQDILTGEKGAIPCWVPIPNHYLAKSIYQTEEDAKEGMRKMYPHANRPDLWENYPEVFGVAPTDEKKNSFPG